MPVHVLVTLFSWIIWSRNVFSSGNCIAFWIQETMSIVYFYLLYSSNLIVWIQRIQYAKTKSDIVAKADGTFVPRERRKRVDEKRKMLANMPFVLHSLFNWCPVCWLTRLFIYISCCLTNVVVIHVCLGINVFALPCTLMFTSYVDLEIKDLSLIDPSHMKT